MEQRSTVTTASSCGKNARNSKHAILNADYEPYARRNDCVPAKAVQRTQDSFHLFKRFRDMRSHRRSNRRKTYLEENPRRIHRRSNERKREMKSHWYPWAFLITIAICVNNCELNSVKNRVSSLESHPRFRVTEPEVTSNPK